MKNALKAGLPLALFLVITALAFTIPTASAAPPAGSDEPDATNLSPFEREVLGWAQDMAGECSKLLEKWIASGAVSEDRLFNRLYYTIPNTNPPKFKTDYDTLADRDLPAIQEKYLGKSPALLAALLFDINGYVPTHNERYSKPLTGDPAVDLRDNRTKRLYNDRVNFLACRSEAPFLIQRYSLDSGDVVLDFAVPVKVRGRHWGAVRIGIRMAGR